MGNRKCRGLGIIVFPDNSTLHEINNVKTSIHGGSQIYTLDYSSLGDLGLRGTAEDILMQLANIPFETTVITAEYYN